MPRNTGNADVEDVAEDELDTPEATADEVKEPKAKKEPARGDLPEGYVTPIGLAKELSKRGLQKDREGNVVAEVKPQMVYSYMKNAPKEDPFPIETIKDSLDKDRQALKLEEGIAWWERKNARAAERKQNAAAKEAKKAEKAAAKEGETSDEPAGEVAEAE